MNKKSLYTIEDADNLNIEEVVELYKNYINDGGHNGKRK